MWACYFGEDCINFTGSGQGGAIAAVFDIALCGTASHSVAATDHRSMLAAPSSTPLARTASSKGYVVSQCSTMACSSFFQNADPDEGLGAGPEAYCVTASLEVQFKAPVTPIPGVFRLDITKLCRESVCKPPDLDPKIISDAVEKDNRIIKANKAAGLPALFCHSK